MADVRLTMSDVLSGCVGHFVRLTILPMWPDSECKWVLILGPVGFLCETSQVKHMPFCLKLVKLEHVYLDEG